METAPSQDRELHQESERVIFTGMETKVVVPEKPLVSPMEGTHLRVSPSQEQGPYYDPKASIAESLRPFLTSLAVARSVFGDPTNRDEYYFWSQWVNVHLVPRFGGENHLQVEVIGRNARGDTWAQPVGYPEGEEYETHSSVQAEEEMLAREIPKNVNNLAGEAQNITLFDRADTEGQYPPDEKTGLQFQNFDIRVPRENPHVEEGGLHFWIYAHREQGAEGVQSDVKNGVEQFILASAVAKTIFQRFGVAIEIHFSGNWGLVPKNEPGENWQERLSAHANLYGAPAGSEGVKLPPRPGYERPAVPEETRQQIIDALQQEVPNYLNEFIGKKLAEVINPGASQ